MREDEVRGFRVALPKSVWLLVHSRGSPIYVHKSVIKVSASSNTSGNRDEFFLSGY
jgi:hypothetical protein